MSSNDPLHFIFETKRNTDENMESDRLGCDICDIVTYFVTVVVDPVYLIIIKQIIEITCRDENNVQGYENNVQVLLGIKN